MNGYDVIEPIKGTQMSEWTSFLCYAVNLNKFEYIYLFSQFDDMMQSCLFPDIGCNG